MVRALTMSSSSSFGLLTWGYKLADVTWVLTELAASSTKASCIASNLKSTVGPNLPHPKKKMKGKCMSLLKSSVPRGLGS